MKNVIFIAPPAAGKGTQSKILVDLGYVHISTGDMLRDEIKKESSIGLKIKDIMCNGGLVSDEIVIDLIADKIVSLYNPFILDGFPRNLKQAQKLDEIFQELNISDYEVIYLDINLEEALKRALGRLICECGQSYNIYYEDLKPKYDNVCDKCGKDLIVRTDDNEKSFKNRFDTFLENIEPIKEFYNSKNKLHIIDTQLGYKKITDRIKDILK